MPVVSVSITRNMLHLRVVVVNCVNSAASWWASDSRSAGCRSYSRQRRATNSNRFAELPLSFSAFFLWWVVLQKCSDQRILYLQKVRLSSCDNIGYRTDYTIFWIPSGAAVITHAELRCSVADSRKILSESAAVYASRIDVLNHILGVRRCW